MSENRRTVARPQRIRFQTFQNFSKYLKHLLLIYLPWKRHLRKFCKESVHSENFTPAETILSEEFFSEKLIQIFRDFKFLIFEQNYPSVTHTDRNILNLT